jgi:GTP-binding protein HflX
MDRTELILEIFAQRAQTKEAKLQVELARTKYQFPRLKRLWSHLSRQRAKGGYLKGEGEKQIEIDRRLLKNKLEKLARELREVKKYRDTQKTARRRSGIPTFAIIGYTNAGKSTLLNVLTEAGVLVEDKLFATLDPTTRKFTLPNHQDILLTDTVGLIRKLPHTLVAAFRSTLEAALQDDVLLHLIDVSQPFAEERAETTYELLQDLEIRKPAMITVLNKADKCPDRKIIDKLRFKYAKTVAISALQKEGIDELLQLMMAELSFLRERVELKIPQSDYAIVALIRREGQILHEEYEGNMIVIRAEISCKLLPQLSIYRQESHEQ